MAYHNIERLNKTHRKVLDFAVMERRRNLQQQAEAYVGKLANTETPVEVDKLLREYQKLILEIRVLDTISEIISTNAGGEWGFTESGQFYVRQ